MSRGPLTVAPDLPPSDALLMLEQRPKPFLTAPVVDDAYRCVGLLRLHDAVRAHLPA
jgi:CBS domain-containing protein